MVKDVKRNLHLIYADVIHPDIRRGKKLCIILTSVKTYEMKLKRGKVVYNLTYVLV